MDAILEFQDLSENPVQVEAKLILDLLTSKSPNLEYSILQKLFLERRIDFEGMSKTKQMESIRKDPYLNGLQVKYGYALTGHKAQGGQWKEVAVCFEGLMPKMTQQDYLRWCYTACTRAEEKLALVGWPFGKRIEE